MKLFLLFALALIPPAAAGPWDGVEKNISEQKYQAAQDGSRVLLKEARRKKDDRFTAEALIKIAQLEVGLHGYESAVKFLREEPWPKESSSEALLNLYSAASLMRYQQAYGYEINQREKTENSKELTALTTSQIGQEIGRHFDLAMKAAPALDKPIPAFYTPYLSAHTFPPAVRPTLRDAITYLAVEHLANQQFWQPKEISEIYRLKPAELFKTEARLPAADSSAHPLKRAAGWLGGLHKTHLAAGRAEAAMEARYALSKLLHSSFTESADRSVIFGLLKEFQKGKEKNSWWARGQALLAEFLLQETGSDRLIKARAEAIAGKNAFPNSVGAQLCASILSEIEQKQYSLAAMNSDSAEKRSIAITYKNITRMHFRVYQENFEAKLKEKNGMGSSQIDGQEAIKTLTAGKPIASWKQELAPTTDYNNHRAFASTPALKPGAYLVISSLDESFSNNSNSVQAVRLTISKLALVTTNEGRGPIEVRAFDAESGQPMAGAKISLYRFRWDEKPQEHSSEVSDANGKVVFQKPFKLPLQQQGWNYFVVGRKGSDFALNAQGLWFGEENPEQNRKSAFLFSDRSIYRPLQKILFKVVAYQGKDGNFEAAKAGEVVKVNLLDSNGRVAGQESVKLNTFGTGSGEFLIPKGKPLGGWQLRSLAFSGSSYIKVEEYKRPTFEANFKDADAPLRLNRPAKLKGEAKYYFGLPVAAGSAKWRVTRTEITPWWWGYWRNPGSPEVVAQGEIPLSADGSFVVDFTPSADERKASDKALTYSFRLEADITDEGGETRTAQRNFRLGFVAVESTLESDREFFEPGKPAKIKARLTNLDGKALAGQATYRVKQLVAPATLLPADLPSNAEIKDQLRSGVADPFPADGLRARWETDFDWRKVTGSWPQGETLAEGKLTHNESGEAEISFSPKSSGVFRLSYETKDAFGETFRAEKDFVVGAKKGEVNLPLLVLAEKKSYSVGETAKVFVHSGLANQKLIAETYRAGRRIRAQVIDPSKDGSILEIPVAKADRGGITLVVTGMRDHQSLFSQADLLVPWADRELKVEFSSFLDKLKPGQKETFRVSVKGNDGAALGAGAAEVLAYMYDRSLDLFGPHRVPSVLSIYPSRLGAPQPILSLGFSGAESLYYSLPGQLGAPSLIPTGFNIQENYGIGGPGRRGGMYEMMEVADMADSLAPAGAPMMAKASAREGLGAMAHSRNKAPAPKEEEAKKSDQGESDSVSAEASPVRSNFSETAFFRPHLILDKNGQTSFEFEVPDSVTSWKVLAHALSRDLRGGSAEKETRSVKELMVRPYVPRFLREGDQAEIKVTVNNSSEEAMNGELQLQIEDADSGKDAGADFQLNAGKRSFTVKKGGSVTLGFPVKAPKKIGSYALKVNGTTKGFSDGERRPLPILPSRMHLAQSRFVTLNNSARKVMEFKDLAAGNDPTLINEKMVVTVDAQLFYGVLQALPYLVNYPYECVEQTINRFVSTGIVSSVFAKYPAIAKMAKDFSQRKTPLEAFDGPDANRRMNLEETPWIDAAEGGKADALENILDSRVAASSRDAALVKLKKMQLSNGGFSWFEGGRPDEYMTLYVLLSFSRALEFKVDVPKANIVNGWKYIRGWLDRELNQMIKEDCCAETITMLNFALSSYPDDSWTGNSFDADYRKRLLEFSFRKWKEHSPLVKGYLALTLNRMDRKADAKLVWDSVMDSAKNSEELGTYWARESKSWLWYNDEIESHAFSLRVQMELDQKDKHNEGLVQWLFLNKKMNHWKSTRATAEVIYSLVHYLDKNSQLGGKEAVQVTLAGQKTDFSFDPEKYSGKKNQILVPGEKIGKQTAKIEVSKNTPGFAFASATWHFSTDQLPKEGRGDFFGVSRKYFKRIQAGGNWQLQPLAEGAKLKVGDQIEVQISLRAKHAAEYVHLRDPRGAGFEPEGLNSGWKWDLGLGWYEEIRDSGANFFFSRLPVGEYTFKYRLRANMAGEFRVGPAEVQSMYAPEFNAYSTGAVLSVME